MNQTRLDYVHIDVARNATDDFNLFHDKKRWQEITSNPFGGPIALGFQLTCFIEDSFNHLRQSNGDTDLIKEHQLEYSNYQINFGNVVRPGDLIDLNVKTSRFKDNKLNNRFVLKAADSIALIGFKSESQKPEFALDDDKLAFPKLSQMQDRTVLPETGYFYKRKFSTNSDAKNFLTGSGAEQSDYFDELEDKIQFPETYCTGLISCALLEQAQSNHHDFRENPMVYTSHKFSVHRERVKALRSNQMLHLLCGPAKELDKGVKEHHCVGLNHLQETLFQGFIQLMPLDSILS